MIYEYRYFLAIKGQRYILKGHETLRERIDILHRLTLPLYLIAMITRLYFPLFRKAGSLGLIDALSSQERAVTPLHENAVAQVPSLLVF